MFTARQNFLLESLFSSRDYPSLEEREEVASSAGLTEEIVRVSVVVHLRELPACVPPLSCFLLLRVSSYAN